MTILHPLHLVFKSPFTHSALVCALAVAEKNHGLLLLENGVYSILKTCAALNEKDTSHLQIYALDADIHACGISDLPRHEHIKIISWEDFITLTTLSKPIISWF